MTTASAVSHPTVEVLDASDWRRRADAHARRADELTAGRRRRAARGETHPVDDFLFTYYSYKPSVLRRWHPGKAVVLEDAAERATWRWYTLVEGVGRPDVTVDLNAYLLDRGDLVAAVGRLLRATSSRPASFGCFGLHEWAMVYREAVPRHDVPLRLGPAETDAVVEASDLRCTHFDAYRFFTDDAVPRNREPLSRELQVSREQPGCLHAGMDLYKWAVKLGPIVPGEVLLDAFELAREIRTIDMRASPYDLRGWGYEPVAIETAEGKAEYVRRQREFTARAGHLRERLLSALPHGESVRVN
ncbi:3-methyladenine DNA glycosylase [Microbacterium sp. P06]|uniref:3-methyladenine DNA glycosylase n=1 Tax=Microbacterium sp. P06 TaxID=3366949 RepID=UPI00374584CA